MADDLTDNVSFFEPLRLMAESEYFRRELLQGLGWDIDKLGDGVAQDLLDGIDEIVDAVDTLTQYFENPPDTLEEFGTALEQVGQLTTAIHDFQNVALDPELAEKLGADIVSFLVTGYLKKQHPALTYLAVVLTLVSPPDPSDLRERLTDSSDEIVRYETAQTDLELDHLGDLLTDPKGRLEDEYWGDGSSEDVSEGVRKLVQRVGGLFESLGVEAFVQPKAIGRDLPPGVSAEVSADNEVASLKLRFDADAGRFTLKVVAYVDDAGKFTVVIVPSASASLSETVSSWELSGSVDGEATAVVVTASDVKFVGDGTQRISVEVGAVRVSEEASGTAFVVGGREDTRLEIGSVSVTGKTELRPGTQEYGVLAKAEDSAIVISPTGADNFLKLVMPDDGMRAEFDLGLGWSTERNVYVEGSAGLETDLPVSISLGEALSFDRLSLGVDLEQFEGGGGSIPVYFTGTLGTKLGPVSAVVENLGLEAGIKFPEDNAGNLGPVDVTLTFKPPDGAGLSIDASAVVGGGYLRFEPEKERYSGTLQLEVGNLTLNAIGLLTTRLPNGKPGFSLLVIITGEFPPVQLGFGFTLNAVGGLLGVNRSTQVEVLRSGVRTGTMRSVLFPKDPVANAPQIVSDLRRIFPPTDARHVFGPMVRLGWGTPTLITAEVGVLLELPAPIRLVILGRISAVLPDEKAPLLELNMDALGVIDFGERTASVDASLYDSRVVAFTLTGDMAMRANWGNDPGFGLSVGGFNPRFSPPSEFPELRRVAIDLGNGKNPRLRLEGYFAVTSNTAQVGSKVDLYAGVGKFSIQGYLGFDALFQFDPFRFIIDIFAGVALKAGGATLMSIDLSGTLAGPTPWHVKGKAKFKILFFTVKVGFDKKFGRSDDPAPIPPANVFGELTDALSESGNWAGQVPDQNHSIVTLREITPAGDQVLVHPLGGLQLRQRIVPLGVRIDKYGNATPAEFDQFEIESVSVSGQLQAVGEATREQFAPAQFFEMSDADKLSKPGFERYQAGHRIGNDLLDFSGKGDPDTDLTVTTTLDYETTHIDEHSNAFGELWQTFGLLASFADALTDVGAVAKSQMRTSGAGKFDGPTQQIETSETGFVVASSIDLSHATEGTLPSAATTRMEAQQALDEYAEAHPEKAENLQVVQTHHARGVRGGQ